LRSTPARPAGTTTPVATSTYRYDGLGRRIEKAGNGQTHRYIYDGEDILLEYDETNTLLARYTHGPGIDEPVAMTRGGSSFFYHQDGLGSVTDLTDSTASTVKTYSYDAWGNQIETSGTVENPYTYTGREFDQESRLYFYRARAYDSTIGRFLQRDPLGLSTGPNPYPYAKNNPTRFVDPLGLKAEDCHDCQRKCQGDYDSCVAVLGLQTSACTLACIRIGFITATPQLVAICLTACGGRAAFGYVFCRLDRENCLTGCQ